VTWQVQEAKQQLSRVLRQAIEEGPQTITLHGEEVAVVMSIEEYRRLTGNTRDFKQFLLGPPWIDDLDDSVFERDASLPREIGK
jgi:prevent-host-death family protein